MAERAFCDWLDVTYSPDADLSAVRDLAQGLCTEVAFDSGDRQGYKFSDDRGVLIVERSKLFQRVSASGGVLAALRGLTMLGEFLGVLSDRPHNVTRLDAALDVPCPDPGAVVRRHYRATRDGVSFGRKSVPTTVLFSPGIDGRDTGTVYHGWRSGAKVTARVYDKSHQVMSVQHGVVDPRVRYELVFRREVGATLHDAYDPHALFWAYGPCIGLKRPSDVPDWVPHAQGACFPVLMPSTAYQRLERAVESIPVSDIARLVAEVGPEGVSTAVRLFQRRLERYELGGGAGGAVLATASPPPSSHLLC